MTVGGVTKINGVSLMNRGQDTVGVAVVQGNQIAFSINSPSAAFGNTADEPIVVVAATVAPDASVGTTYPLTISSNALTFNAPGGTSYPLEIANGLLTVANAVTIGNVKPGSTMVPAGGVVTISGTNFTPQTRLQIDDAVVSETRYVSSSRIDVVLAQAIDMHGMRVQATNADNSEATYYASERTSPVTLSSDPVLSRAIPLFAPALLTHATFDLDTRSGSIAVTKRRATAPPRPVTPTRGSYGFAVQNLGTATIDATVELLDRSGNPYAVNTISVKPDQYMIRELSEVFGFTGAAAAIRINSEAPLQMLGIVIDRATGAVSAIPPG
jgi:hypothetical protein